MELLGRNETLTGKMRFFLIESLIMFLLWDMKINKKQTKKITISQSSKKHYGYYLFGRGDLALSMASR